MEPKGIAKDYAELANTHVDGLSSKLLEPKTILETNKPDPSIGDVTGQMEMEGG